MGGATKTQSKRNARKTKHCRIARAVVRPLANAATRKTLRYLQASQPLKTSLLARGGLIWQKRSTPHAKQGTTVHDDTERFFASNTPGNIWTNASTILSSIVKLCHCCVIPFLSRRGDFRVNMLVIAIARR